MVKNDSFTTQLVTMRTVGCPMARFGCPAHGQPRGDVTLRRKQLYLEVAVGYCRGLANNLGTPGTCTGCTRVRSHVQDHIRNICTSVFSEYWIARMHLRSPRHLPPPPPSLPHEFAGSACKSSSSTGNRSAFPQRSPRAPDQPNPTPLSL